jgi:3-methyladenine DNA glycosylase AlkD/predicted nucleotidyltransferase
MNDSDFNAFLGRFIDWAAHQVDLQAAALIGSYARGTPQPDSDLDLVMLVEKPKKYLADLGWITQFGQPLQQQVEDYGKLISLRVWYASGIEVEFGLSNPDWAAQPVDPGTDRVVMDGVRLLFERRPLLSLLLDGFEVAARLSAEVMRSIQVSADRDRAAQNRCWFKNADFRSYGLNALQQSEIARQFRPSIRDLPLRGRLHLARLLVLNGYAEPANLANSILSWAVQELSPDDFSYLDAHVRCFHSWGNCDDFCLNVLQPLLFRYPEPVLALLHDWNRSDNAWQRRASVVVFTRKAGASGAFTEPALELCGNLLDDPDDLVQKGVGWALKDLRRGDPQPVMEYIAQLRQPGVTATITLYALRGLPKAERQKLLAIRPTRRQ